MWMVNIGTIAGLLLIIYTPLNHLLKLAPLSWKQLILAAALAVVSVGWYEVVKGFKRWKRT
jgi:Ca2+-transporting ATPase